MFINQEFINNLSPVEVAFIRIGIDKLFKEKSNAWNDKLWKCFGSYCEMFSLWVCAFRKEWIQSTSEVKVQMQGLSFCLYDNIRYIIHALKNHFRNMVKFHSRWIERLILAQQSVITGLSITTCFNMRHKLYKAAYKIRRNTVLHGEVELDPTYTSINLKGTKREKCRISASTEEEVV